MALFASPAVKDLKKQADEIGSMIGQVALGMLPANDVADVIARDDRRARLHKALRAVAAEVGDAKALKIAVKAAREGAEPWVRTTQVNITDCYDQAEETVREMLAE
jgi:hypothetical protein